jgi:hypothetical protein
MFGDAFEQRFGTCMSNANLDFHRFEPRTLLMQVPKRCSKTLQTPLNFSSDTHRWNLVAIQIICEVL